MDHVVYQQMYNLEKNHWWFRGKRAIISAMLKQTVHKPLASALDIGCGSGFNAYLLKPFAEKITGLESSDEAIRQAKVRSPKLHIIKGAWPQAHISGTFGIITCFDVLEHIRDDGSAIKRIEQILNPGGYLVITVPALPLLWSDHDVLANHFRRYTARELRKRITQHTSLEVVRVTYFNSILFVPILLFRAVKKLFRLRSGETDIFDVPLPANELLARLFAAERIYLRFLNAPFGVSLLCIARKPE